LEPFLLTVKRSFFALICGDSILHTITLTALSSNRLKKGFLRSVKNAQKKFEGQCTKGCGICNKYWLAGVPCRSAGP
jgi:hypothetical protein